jgi:Mnd1 HTH domain
MVKKGLSLDQKRDIILGIFHENDEVFQLKEIEKKAAARGVTLQSIKDVVQSLVDDDLVHQVCSGTKLPRSALVSQQRDASPSSAQAAQQTACLDMPPRGRGMQDKIGIAIFLWSFGAEASTKIKNEEGRLQKAVEAAQVRTRALHAAAAVACCRVSWPTLAGRFTHGSERSAASSRCY